MQCWPRCMSPYGIIGPKLVNWTGMKQNIAESVGLMLAPYWHALNCRLGATCLLFSVTMLLLDHFLCSQTTLSGLIIGNIRNLILKYNDVMTILMQKRLNALGLCLISIKPYGIPTKGFPLLVRWHLYVLMFSVLSIKARSSRSG